MTDEKFLRGCVGFFLYPVTSVLLSLGFIGVGLTMLLQDFGICLAALMCLFLGFGIQYLFPIPSLLIGKDLDEEI